MILYFRNHVGLKGKTECSIRVHEWDLSSSSTKSSTDYKSEELRILALT